MVLPVDPNFEKDQTTDADKLIIHYMLISNPFSHKTVNNFNLWPPFGLYNILTILFTTPLITSWANNFRHTEYLRNPLQLMRSTWKIKTMVLSELSQTMGYITRNTVNRLVRKELHSNPVVLEGSKEE